MSAVDTDNLFSFFSIARDRILLILLQICGLASSQRYTHVSQNNVKIGGIFPENSEHLVNAFQSAVQYFNTYSEKLKLQTAVRNVDTSDSFKVHQAVCDLIQKKDSDDDSLDVAAIFGPNSPRTAGVVASICKKLQIPHFVAVWQPTDTDSFNGTDSFTRNLFPQSKKYSEALYEIVKSFQWKKFAIIYDSDDSLVRLQEIFPISAELQYTTHKQSMKFYRLPADSDYKPMLKDISKSGVSQVMIDCTLENIYSIWKQSSSVGMMNEYVKYFIANHDGYTMDLSTLVNVTANIITVRLMNPDNIDVNEYPQNRRFNVNLMTTEAALIKDAVKVLSKALEANSTFINDFQMNLTSCYEIDSEQEPSTTGKDFLSNIDGNSVDGLTETINFNEDGQRNAFYVEALEFQRNNDDGDSYNKIAKYRYPWPDPLNKVEYLTDSSNSAERTEINMQKKLFKVMMRPTPPFCSKRRNVTPAPNMTVTDIYEGFSIDLIAAIAEKCKFRYEIEVTEIEYGKEDPVTKQWSGIVGEIVNKRVDLAIGDITITHARKTAIDFSTPFMTLGISILYSKPHKETAGLFSFMDPLSMDVWLHMATGFLCISITEFLLAKIAAMDWENPHPCDDDPEELENIWNMHNCIWLSVGSIMQQGCDILPKSVPPRLAAVVWWFFALIVISSYTANLAAFLTKVQSEASINDIEDLASQSEIQYGLVGGGSTESFFKNSNYSTYQKMWGVMEKAEPSVIESSNNAGMERVKRSNRKYAFFMESAPIAYITHRDCNLTQVGGLLDSKEYGIGMPANSPYRQDISIAVLNLQEDGTIHNLTELWWKTKNTDEEDKQINCAAGEKEKSDTLELGMDNVGGVFLVLGVGLILPILVGMLEFIWSVRQTSIEERITPFEAFKKELFFAASVWELRKPIGPSASERSSTRSDSSDEEKPEEIRLNSIKSIKHNGINGINSINSMDSYRN